MKMMCVQMLDNKKNKKPLNANKNYKKNKKILPTNDLKR